MKPSYFILTVLALLLLPTAIPHDYSEALRKSILFFEGQRSGRLPKQQRMTWRGDSALNDGKNLNTDLVGGYYDAGDNIKFHFPMAFTATMLAWSSIDFQSYMSQNDLGHNLIALKWATDYLLKTVSQLPNRIFVQVRTNKPPCIVVLSTVIRTLIFTIYRHITYYNITSFFCLRKNIISFKSGWVY